MITTHVSCFDNLNFHYIYVNCQNRAAKLKASFILTCKTPALDMSTRARSKPYRHGQTEREDEAGGHDTYEREGEEST